jgi:hypothetical protein
MSLLLLRLWREAGLGMGFGLIERLCGMSVKALSQRPQFRVFNLELFLSP